MATNKTYTKVEIEAIKEGLNHYFPYEVGDISSPKTVDDNWSDINKLFKWYGRDDFFTTLSEATGIQKLSFAEIKSASGRLEKMEAAAPEATEYKGSEDSPVSANRPGKEMLEQLEKEDQVKETQRKETVEQSNQDVRDAIKRKQEIYGQEIQKAKDAEAILKNKKIYYKVEKVPVEETQEIKNLKEQAEANPQKFIKDAEGQFRNNPNLKNLSGVEAQVVSQQAAVTGYEVLTGNSPLIQSAVISRIVSDPKILNSIPDVKTREYLKSAAEILTNQKISQYELSKQLMNFSKIDGYGNVNDIKIEISSTPQPGFKEFDLNEKITTPHIESLNQQNFLFDNLKGFGEGEIKSQILSTASVRLESYIAGLPAGSLLAKTYNSEIVQLGLSSLGFVEAAPWVAIEGSFVGKIAVGSGLGPAAGFIQAKTGINLGVKLAAKTGVKTAAEAGTAAVVEAGAATVAKTGFKAAFSKITASLGTAGGPIGIVLGWLGGEALVKIAEKIPWHKIKKWSAAIVGVTAGAITFPLLGLGGSIGVSLGATGISVALGAPLGGLSLTGIGNGIAFLSGIIARIVIGAALAPILSILIGFPLLIALILFIINSGAYMVPPSPVSLSSGEIITSPYIEVTKVAIPTGPFQNSELPLTVEYQITIRAKKGILSNVSISYDCNVIKKNGSVKCPETMPAMPAGVQIPGNTISPTSTFEFSYKQTYGVNFEDSLVTDTITVSADTPEQLGAEAAASAGIKIGNPPDSCPAGWPVSGQWVITQTPGGGYSHTSVEAMDIGTSMGTPVRATHSGIARVVYTSNAYAPVYVAISSNCGGKDIESWYAHLSAVTVTNGQQVTMGQLIGATGTGGSGPHLHYEFRKLRMDVPYIPKSIQRGCSSNAGCGSIP
jgi:hypothetical protein